MVTKKNKCTCGCDSVGSNYHSDWCDSLLPVVEESLTLKNVTLPEHFKISEDVWRDLIGVDLGSIGNWTTYSPHTVTGAKDLLRGNWSFKLIPPTPNTAYPPDAFPDTDEDESDSDAPKITK